MKKAILMSCFCAVAVFFTACGGENTGTETPENQDSTKVEASVNTPTPTVEETPTVDSTATTDSTTTENHDGHDHGDNGDHKH